MNSGFSYPISVNPPTVCLSSSLLLLNTITIYPPTVLHLPQSKKPIATPSPSPLPRRRRPRSFTRLLPRHRRRLCRRRPRSPSPIEETHFDRGPAVQSKKPTSIAVTSWPSPSWPSIVVVPSSPSWPSPSPSIVVQLLHRLEQ